jgi:hypothetical protein
MATAGVAANARTRRSGYTPPQQPQRRRPGTAAKTAGSANMPSWCPAGPRLPRVLHAPKPPRALTSSGSAPAKPAHSTARRRHARQDRKVTLTTAEPALATAKSASDAAAIRPSRDAMLTLSDRQISAHRGAVWTVPSMAGKRRGHAPDAKTRRPKYEPRRVADMAALDAAIEGFVREHSYALTTRKGYEERWTWWKEHCERVGRRRKVATAIDPLRAPFFVFEDLATECRGDGKPLAVGTVRGIASAVTWRCGDQSLVPAHKRTEHAADWEMLMRGKEREEALRRAAGDPPRKKVTPLLRNDLAVMLVAGLPSSLRLDAVRASVLLALDRSLTVSQLDSLDVSDVEPLAAGAIRVAGVQEPLLCDHAERARGVPWDCTACALLAVLAAHPGDGPLFVHGSRSLSTFMSGRRRAWPGLVSGRHFTPALPADPSLTDWQLAGLRRGLVLQCRDGRCWPQDRGFQWVRARAWAAAAWTCGFRMASDLIALDRRAVSRDPAGRGYRIELRGTKDDSPGEKDVTRPLEWSQSGGPSAAQAMAEYLAVRDAATGRGGALLLSTASHGHRALEETEGFQVARRDLDLLCKLAGLSRVYSSYSTRHGYTQQAELDGWTVEDIQQGLRHQRLDTTLRHYTGASSARQAVTKLMSTPNGAAA